MPNHLKWQGQAASPAKLARWLARELSMLLYIAFNAHYAPCRLFSIVVHHQMANGNLRNDGESRELLKQVISPGALELSMRSKIDL